MTGVLDVSAMPLYQKRLRALKIKEIQFEKDADYATIIPEEGFDSFEVDRKYLIQHEPKVGGYFVVESDGWVCFMVAEQLEQEYAIVDRIIANAESEEEGES